MTLPQRPLKDKDGTQFAPIVERFIGAIDTSRTLNWNTEYTAEEDGWIRFQASGVAEQSMQLLINGIVTFSFKNDGDNTSIPRFIVPIKQGQKFKAEGGDLYKELTFFKTA